ncbi:hypothetical protein SAMN05880574_11555 [Chryseobacterium sp. RU37D]|uniref:hypothetical protein n=1 Tax=Chryseobacterium sp. RU37D TaxID=1907397 RepID=UPI0009569F05|nr:hypothetical protein [Chryseobacterium sp. RU37D]SIQ52533.1 hypothetical protein SAMN05880574_11555 [Chryseobacterium sp. RU37D]
MEIQQIKNTIDDILLANPELSIEDKAKLLQIKDSIQENTTEKTAVEIAVLWLSLLKDAAAIAVVIENLYK